MEFLPFAPSYENIFASDIPANIFKIVHSYGQPGWALPSHFHPDQSELMYVAGGKAIYTVNNTTYHVSAGDLIIFNSNVVHSLESDYHDPLDVWSCAVRDFEIKGLAKNNVLPDNAPPVYHTGEKSPLFQQIYSEILSQRQSEAPGFNSICSSLANTLLVLCYQLSRNSYMESESESVILARKVLKYLDNHYSEQISMESLSKEFNISSSRLSHIVNDTFHISPISYLIDRRIRQAQWQLVSTDYSIKEIGERVGYENTQHFTKLFKERIGVSPFELKDKYTIQASSSKPAHQHK